MFKQKKIFIGIFFFFIIGMSGCHDKMYQEYTLNTPIYMSLEELRSSVKVSPPQSLQKPGKIYFKDNLIFINEGLKGIHIVDNENPVSPEFIGFIKIPGNVDIAVRGNILYADSYIDLVAFDISNPEDIQKAGRLKDVFPPVIPPIDDRYGINTDEIDEEKGVIVGWEVKTHLKEIKPDDLKWPYHEQLFWDGAIRNFSAISGGSSSGGNTTFGTGGSMARFTLFSDYLYAVDDRDLKIINVADPAQMREENSIQLTWRGLETIFQYDEKLFFGTQTGMLVYDLANPLAPGFISELNHIQSCDPVVVQGDLAYVTLRAGNNCGRGVNRLDIVDLKDITLPVILKSYDMSNPHGLGIDSNSLFVCDGNDGLKVYDAEDPLRLKKIAEFPEIHAWDVIPVNGLLFMIGEDGFFQYDYSGPDDITLLSSILVDNP